VIASLNGGHTH